MRKTEFVLGIVASAVSFAAGVINAIIGFFTDLVMLCTGAVMEGLTGIENSGVQAAGAVRAAFIFAPVSAVLAAVAGCIGIFMLKKRQIAGGILFFAAGFLVLIAFALVISITAAGIVYLLIAALFCFAGFLAFKRKKRAYRRR